MLDGREVLASFMGEELPDAGRFRALAGGLLDGAAAAAPRRTVRAYGELVALLTDEGRVPAAIALERLWNEVLSTRPCRLYCAYPLRQFAHAELAQAFCEICDGHDLVVPEHARCMAVLQQHSRALEAELAERRRSEERLETLLRMTQVLSTSLDLEATIANTLTLAVPAFGDFGWVEVMEHDERLRRVVRAHDDPGTERELEASEWASAPLEHWTRRALSSGGPLLHRETDEAFRMRVASGPGELALMRRLEIRSMAAVPLACDGRVLGALTLFQGRSGRRHGERDLELARELAYRAATALANALLCRERAGALARLAEADRRKDEFLAMLGHELRNPLAPFLTAVQLMELHGDAGSRRERDVIRRQAEHLTRLVDDLLDVSRIVRGNVTVRRRTIEISAVLAKAVEMAAPLLEQFGHTLSLDVPRAGLAVRGDPFRLAQVFSNLLTNAAKYTSRCGVVRVAARREGDVVAVEVADNGCGIRAEALPTLFEPFVQGASTRERAQGGLGLGLALVKALSELHGGSVSASSAGPGRGSTFTVRLPTCSLVMMGAEELDRPAPPERAAGRRLLLVDDNRDAAETLAMALEESGYDVIVANDAAAALASAQRSPPDIAIIDIGLPVMNGWELAARLRERYPRGTLRLVALTGYGQDADRERSSRAGFDLHLVKPVELATVLRATEPSACPASTGTA